MRILIVASNREKAPIPVAPIGAATIATVLKEAGHTVGFLDFMWLKKPLRDLERVIGKFKPDLVGISIRNVDNSSWMNNVWYLDDARGYVEAARRFSGGKPVIIGGPSVGVLPGPITAYVGADYAVWGDGERATVELVKQLEEDGKPSEVPGVVTPNFHGEGQHRVNEQFRVEELGAIPNHRMWEWLDFNLYVQRAGPLQIQTRRGCVFKCSYCIYPKIEGDTYRSKPPQQVADEVEFMAKSFPGAAIEFVDNTFNVPLNYTLKMLDAIIAKGLDLTLHTNGFNPRATSEELMEKMHQAGFSQVMITPEVANEQMLANLDKGFTMKQLNRAAQHRRWLQEQGSPMEWMWVFLLGGPGETKETVMDTFKWIEDEVPKGDMSFVQVGLRVYPDTPLHHRCIDMGVVKPEDDLLASYHFVSPELEPLWVYETLMDQIKKNPDITTLKDVMNPGFPFYLRVSGALGVKAPMTSGRRGLRLLSRLGLRQVGPDGWKKQRP